jgi:hypothetical protein
LLIFLKFLIAENRFLLSKPFILPTFLPQMVSAARAFRTTPILSYAVLMKVDIFMLV